MKIFEHANYDHYKRAQSSHVENHQRIIKQRGLTEESGEALGWAKDSHLIEINNTIERLLGNYRFNIICHGVRNGYEAKFFMDRIGIDRAYSTDLSNVFMFNRTNFFHQDFDTVVESWEGAFDALYSNSVDHSRNPGKTLGMWADQLRTDGIMAINFSCGPKATDCDCFALSITDFLHEIQSLITDNRLPLEIVKHTGPHYGKKHIGVAGTVNMFLRKV